MDPLKMGASVAAASPSRASTCSIRLALQMFGGREPWKLFFTIAKLVSTGSWNNIEGTEPEKKFWLTSITLKHRCLVAKAGPSGPVNRFC